MYKQGQKAVCINEDIDPSAKDFHSRMFPNWVEKDKIYTIRSCVNTSRGWAVLLEELKNPFTYIDDYSGRAEGRFLATRFAPLLTDDIDISEEIKEVLEEV